MATTLLPLTALLLSSGFGEPPRTSLFPEYNNYGLQRSPYNYYPAPRRDFYWPSIFDERDPFDFLPWKGFGDLAFPNYLNKDGLNIVLNVQGYRPDELEVRVITRQVLVRGKHEEDIEKYPTETIDKENKRPEPEVIKPDKPGKSLKQFERRYIVPPNVDLDKITTSVSSDGILTIRAPFKDVPKEEEGKKVTIEETKKPHPKPERRPQVDTNTHEVKNTETKKHHVEHVTREPETNKHHVEPVTREPESREESTVEVKKNSAEENDIDGVSVTDAPEELTPM